MKVAIIGECMLEIANAAGGDLAKGMACRFNYGGDTLNTAVYMKRLGAEVAYFSALGSDIYSQWLLKEWQLEGLDTSYVLINPNAMPGLYMIQTDSEGERSFSYWRGQSAARQWLQDEQAVAGLLRELADFDVLYLTGITLSLMSNAVAESFVRGVAALKKVKPLKVVFDINYRPRGWSSEEMARARMASLLKLTDLALPTFDDEKLLFGDASPAQTQARYEALGVKECIIKLGGEGALVCAEGSAHRVASENVSQVVDTTGAGDSFNGAFLAKYLLGGGLIEACKAGHKLAGTVIQHRGAIIATSDMPSLMDA
ncbi:MAG TPA: sugar kinase [Pseudomonadales bacterium]|nr:sugar kinase [Pseudomonadales bacterium]